MAHISEVINDELHYYLVTHYGYLMTAAEFNAHKTVHLRLKFPKPTEQENQQSYFRLADGDNPEVRSLFAEGEQAFFVNVCARMQRDSSDTIFLNYCPECGGLARTPKAKQCPHCFFSWHNRKEP